MFDLFIGVEFNVEYLSLKRQGLKCKRLSLVPLCAVNDQKANEDVFNLLGCNSDFGCLKCRLETERQFAKNDAEATTTLKNNNSNNSHMVPPKPKKETTNSFLSTSTVLEDGKLIQRFKPAGARTLQSYLAAMQSNDHKSRESHRDSTSIQYLVLQYYDEIFDCLVGDCLHVHEEGFVKRFLKNIMKEEKRWCFAPSDIQMVDKIIGQLRSKHLAKLPPLSRYKSWKAHHYREFTCYYGCMVMRALEKTQPKSSAFHKCVELFDRYSASMRIIYSRRAAKSDLNIVKKELEQIVGKIFVARKRHRKQLYNEKNDRTNLVFLLSVDFGELFGRLQVKSTIHLITHTVTDIFNWGSSTVISGYNGEDLNWFFNGMYRYCN